MDKTLHTTTKEKENYTKLIDNNDTLLTELDGAIGTLYCVWSVLTDTAEATQDMRNLLLDSLYSNIEHLKRVSTDLQAINDGLWGIKKASK